MSKIKKVADKNKQLKRKKGQSGSAVTYISRSLALKKLQIPLRDFRRLCILKGVYPHEPAHKKKVNLGSTTNKVYYYRKDINFLAHEPIINKFREYKVFLRRLNHLKARKEDDKLKKLYENKPAYDEELDRLVKERYPTFASAIYDLDDALCLCFVFATLPHTRIIKQNLVEDCRRLTAEFMHYVIESNSLRNTFVSIKGVYYQAEICGEKVTWLVPHDRGVPRVTDVDFGVLVTFAEFHCAMMGFVNFRLYNQLGLYYPPQIQTGQNVVEAGTEENDEEYVEKIYSLAKPLAKRSDAPLEDEDVVEGFGDDDNALAEKIKEAKTIRSLFQGCVFWLNRETPKESLTVLIRNCGGTVGWEGAPSSLTEESRSITHQVVDRPLNKFDVNRRYVQPQWIFDSLNARRKLPTEKYMPGVTLPPHFSPFAVEQPGDYVSVERLEELRGLGKDVSSVMLEAPKVVDEKKKSKKKEVAAPEKGMRVDLGKMFKTNKQHELNQQGADLKLRESMIAKKHKRVYHSIRYTLRKNRNEAMKLKKKRIGIEQGKTAETA